jgi:phage tail-like protein
MSNGSRVDPYSNFRFKIECSGVIEAAFSEVSGLSLEVETEDYVEGGVNNFVHKLPKGAKTQNLVLKRGLTDKESLWNWGMKSIDAKFEKKNITIFLQDAQGQNTSWSWFVQNAYPVKWSGPDLKASSAEIALETLELAHEGITKN